MQTNTQMEKGPYPTGVPSKSDKFVRAKDQLASDFGTLVSDAEELLRSTASYSGDAVNAARDKFKGTLDYYKGRVAETQKTVVGKIDQAATATDGYVHENPWRVAGVAALVGLLIGVLLHRK
jgi:ElaB/YqjD/DUF883 family membrane-anchored ribosome-binding protein